MSSRSFKEHSKLLLTGQDTEGLESHWLRMQITFAHANPAPSPCRLIPNPSKFASRTSQGESKIQAFACRWDGAPQCVHGQGAPGFVKQGRCRRIGLEEGVAAEGSSRASTAIAHYALRTIAAAETCGKSLLRIPTHLETATGS